jgi:hypothetical protein
MTALSISSRESSTQASGRDDRGRHDRGAAGPTLQGNLVAAPCYLEAGRTAFDRRSGEPQLRRVPFGYGRRYLCVGPERRRGRRCLRARARKSGYQRSALHRRLGPRRVGIAYVFEPLVGHSFARAAALAHAKRDRQPGLFLYFPRGASEAPKLRSFIDAAREVFNAGSGRPANRRARRPLPAFDHKTLEQNGRCEIDLLRRSWTAEWPISAPSLPRQAPANGGCPPTGKLICDAPFLKLGCGSSALEQRVSRCLDVLDQDGAELASGYASAPMIRRR